MLVNVWFNDTVNILSCVKINIVFNYTVDILSITLLTYSECHKNVETETVTGAVLARSLVHT